MRTSVHADQLEKDDLANDAAYGEIVADTRDELLTFGALASLIVPRPDPFALVPADDECAKPSPIPTHSRQRRWAALATPISASSAAYELVRPQ